MSFYVKFLLSRFVVFVPEHSRFCSRTFFDCLSEFFTAEFFFFGDLSYFHPEIKFIVNIVAIVSEGEAKPSIVA